MVHRNTTHPGDNGLPDEECPTCDFDQLADCWAIQREEEAATMCAKRTLTEEEIDRAMVIAKWFFGWTDKTGPCPIGCTDEHWHKKLCALFEWIAVLETEASKDLKEIRHGY